jgi:hypothetical protein
MGCSIAQARANFAAAQAARTAHDRLRRQVRRSGTPWHGRRLVADALLDPPELVDTMRIHTLLCCIPRTGPARATALLERERLHEHHTLADLTIGQALRLAARLGGPLGA